MQQLPVPQKIEWVPQKAEHTEKVVIEPCYPGYGMTLGTALRRILLSSLSGSAPVAVKIKGVLHEFSAMSGVKEDVMDIILAIKKIRLKLFSEEEVRLTMKASGQKEVKAKDIDKNALVEIANPSEHLATLTSSDAELEMEIFVRPGRGYLPVEDRGHEEREIGKILIDALFSPITNVGFKVEHIRVGEMTNFERLILTIATDGTITPREAFLKAIEILEEQFRAIKAPYLPASDGKETPEETSDVMKTEETAKEVTASEGEEEKPKKRGRKKKIE